MEKVFLVAGILAIVAVVVAGAFALGVGTAAIEKPMTASNGAVANLDPCQTCSSCQIDPCQPGCQGGPGCGGGGGKP